ncbi:ThiF family adenylyltransferase [Frankia sp. CNm7]|uniref:ThiF family adenylyltransferase n=2 Tax=Frankia nepalensis TaxID=1836974 RepID=A0A937UW94_9ACTN|nr:ThiF family adenylyltransferase [Frankia nepalensis]MBL7500762.1 ThiF family adenylyltransferase [Frankia nepalensis]MBL7511750.1 ThiF family adenylyltransferase [Frankia nepalensis]MBL7521334.1 ThiF family adenylyltransferase [Frankia nepalensis]MBL7633166.1 ThiF family adenylyltransferase [Frankia nepalensis]
MRPVLKPGLRRLWRDGSTLQLGVDPSLALVLPDVTPAHAAALGALDGSRTSARLRADGDPATIDLLDLLDEAGLLDDATVPDDDADEPPLTAVERDRLRPDHAALSLATRDPDGARRALARRRAARVRVQGAGRVGAHVAALLAAAGIGRVVVDDAGLTGPGDVGPGALSLDDVGRPRAAAALAALGRVTRSPAPARTARPFRPDLVVLTPAGLPVPRPDEALALEREGVPHLLAGVRETTGVVGPFVVPGRTSCLHCQHLVRYTADPAWPLLALQLARRAETGPDACEVTLAAMVSALTAAQALAFVDAGAHRATDEELPRTAGGTLEIAPPDWRVRRRTWPPHPDCPCRGTHTPDG